MADTPKITERLHRMLHENILPFWYPDTVDQTHGGYHLNHDHDGRFLGPGMKMLVTQARTMWFYAYIYNNGLNEEKYLDAARHGYDFLINKLWDKEHQGFFWASDAEGSITRERKHLYGQGFALYALSEYYLACQKPEVLEWAGRLFQVMEKKAYDTKFGGYRESFARDWSNLPPDEINYIEVPHSYKLMNTHLHLMEPMTVYYQASKDTLARERLLELIRICSNTVVRKTIGACTDKYSRDWLPIRLPEYDVVSYGHDIETIWLLMHACDTAGLANAPLTDLYRTLFEYSHRYGFDRGQGGWYYTGPFNQPAQNRTKIWWVQAEGLVAALEMYLRLEDAFYWDCFTQTLDWIETQQTDWQNGDWHANIPTQPANENKAHPWKGPYHNGRAILRCLKILNKT